MNAAARRQLAKIGVDIDVTARTSELTFAARQMVELAKALTLEEAVERPLLILLDEPTSVLNAADIDVLFDARALAQIARQLRLRLAPARRGAAISPTASTR